MKIALTGHRPERLPDEEIIRGKFREIYQGNPGISVVINGLAAGADLWGADEALNLGIEVWSARPWAGHRPRNADRDLYYRVVQGSSQVVNVAKMDTFPGNWCYQKRNEWMVDHADNVLAVWDGHESGGTWNCISYATEQDKKVKYLKW